MTSAQRGVVTFKKALGLRHYPVKISLLICTSLLLSGCMNKILYGRQRALKSNVSSMAWFDSCVTRGTGRTPYGYANPQLRLQFSQPLSCLYLTSRNATLLVPANAWCLPTLGDRAFQWAAPKLWNSLPAEIRNIQSLTSFKGAL